MTITIFVKIRSDEMAPIRKEKEGIHHSREHCIWLKVGKLLLKRNCWKKQMGTSTAETRMRLSKSAEIRCLCIHMRSE